MTHMLKLPLFFAHGNMIGVKKEITVIQVLIDLMRFIMYTVTMLAIRKKTDKRQALMPEQSLF